VSRGLARARRACEPLAMSRWKLPTFLLSALLLAGCPNSNSAQKSGPAASCVKRSEQCKLSDGLLGVCSDVPCPAGREPPCLKCQPQH